MYQVGSLQVGFFFLTHNYYSLLNWIQIKLISQVDIKKKTIYS